MRQKSATIEGAGGGGVAMMGSLSVKRSVTSSLAVMVHSPSVMNVTEIVPTPFVRVVSAGSSRPDRYW